MTSGRCLCGAVRYETTETPTIAFACYCETCRRESGAGHLTIVPFKEESFAVHGELKRIDLPREGGAKPIPRFFCPGCGTVLFARPDPGLYNVRAGTLDQIVELKIVAAEYASRAQPWDKAPAGVRTYE